MDFLTAGALTGAAQTGVVGVVFDGDAAGGSRITRDALLRLPVWDVGRPHAVVTVKGCVSSFDSVCEIAGRTRSFSFSANFLLSCFLTSASCISRKLIEVLMPFFFLSSSLPQTDFGVEEDCSVGKMVSMEGLTIDLDFLERLVGSTVVVGEEVSDISVDSVVVVTSVSSRDNFSLKDSESLTVGLLSSFSCKLLFLSSPRGISVIELCSSC